jgi:hypothetical protein
VAALETSGSPDSSGISKRMGFADVKEPRLINVAANLEGAMNTALRFLELRFGVPRPEGVVTLPRSFDLKDLIASVERVFDIARGAGIRSRTMDANLMMAVLDDEGLISDDEERAIIEAELAAASGAAATREEQERSFLDNVTDFGAAVVAPDEDVVIG